MPKRNFLYIDFRTDLLSMVGTAKETLVRLLHDFKSAGIVETTGRIIRITNRKRNYQGRQSYWSQKSKKIVVSKGIKGTMSRQEAAMVLSGDIKHL